MTDELDGVEYRKPNEKASELIKERFGVEFSEMCYVGDNISKDFIAPLWFRNTEGLYC